jgi:phosphoribosylformimino-5-aminoimidazole carboxamide ribotide isomerase
MIIPCIDIMDGKVVQLVQGREKALEGAPPLKMLERFSGFPVIQVIDLDAALSKGENNAIVELLASRARIRAGGGVRTPERARTLVDCGAEKVIVGTSAFTKSGVNHALLGSIAAEVGADKILVALDSKGGRIVVKGWTESLDISAEEILAELEPHCSGYLCTYVDKEGMLQGTDLDWFRRLRAATSKEITAAGGITTIEEVRELLALNIHAALGMAIYTGRLDLAELRWINQSLNRGAALGHTTGD